RVRSVARCGRDRSWSLLPRFPADGEAFLHHLRDQRIERLLEHGREIAVESAVAEEVLRLAKLVAQGARSRKLNLEGLRRQRRNDVLPLLASRQRDSQSRRGGREGLGQLGDGPSRKLANVVRNRWLWTKACCNLLDLSLRLAGSKRQNPLVVLFAEMRGEYTQTGEMHPSRAERVEDGRNL